MKLSYTIYTALAVMALAACQAKEEALPQEPEVPEGYKTLQINASYQETKTAYAGDVTFSWTEGDEIAVICNDGTENSWVSLVAVTPGGSATEFSAVVEGAVATGSLTGTRMALFPVSDQHRYTDDTAVDFYIPAVRDFRDSENTAIPMFAYGDDSDAYAFANMCGAIKFVFEDLPAGISEVKLVYQSAWEKLNGLFPLINLGGDATAVTWEIASAASYAERSLTLYEDVKGGGVAFYIPFPGGTISEGSSVLLVDANDESNVLFQHDYLKEIEVVKNRITVLTTQKGVDLTSPSSELTFTESAHEFRNPERGFNNPNTFDCSSMPYYLYGDALGNDMNSNSLVFLLFYLSDYRYDYIPSDVLTEIGNVFAQVRDLGKKAVVRFAYSNHKDNEDAPLEWVEKHLVQLTPVLQDNEDVIYVVQAGFIGIAGEWHADSNTNSYFYFDWKGADKVDTGQFEDYAKVIKALLEAVPKSRQVALRTWYYKRFYFYTRGVTSGGGVWNPISAWETTANSRLSFHNDGFASYEHEGGSFTGQLDRDMCASQSAYMAVGGEPYSKYSYTMDGYFENRMDRVMETVRNQHISYLSDFELYGMNALDWMDPDQKNVLCKALGYRLWLSDVKLYVNGQEEGKPMTIQITLNNSGSAPVINKRPMKLVLLRDGVPPTVLVENLGEVRDVPPGGSRTFTRTFTIPACGIQGNDKLALWFPDASLSIADRAAYAIRLANDGIEWETSDPSDPALALGGYNVFTQFL